jgi:phosphonate transport system ATP-binding protein
MTTYLHGSYLSLRDVSVTYAGGYQALQPTNLDIAKGQFLVLLGPSGAGKSTLLRSINRLVTPITGTITLADLPAKSSASKQLRQLRRQCAMVFQQHHLIGRQTVLSNVLMGLLATRGPLASVWPWGREDKFKALAAIERVGLLDKALSRADMLSGGQQQRVGIARALVQAPRVLLADEPVASLDPTTAHDILLLLHEICKLDGLTALVSLHQVDLAQSFADRIVGLRQGAVVFDASPDQLKPEVLARLYSGVALNSFDIADDHSRHQSQHLSHFVSQNQESQPC